MTLARHVSDVDGNLTHDLLSALDEVDSFTDLLSDALIGHIDE